MANLTCAMRANGMGDNSVLVLVSDNGCDADTIVGCSYPFAGSKATHARGGVSSRALISSQLVPEARRGATYEGLAHVTDWLPTFMGLATGGQWTGSYTGEVEIDGVDLWPALLANEASPRREVLHELKKEDVSIQLDMLKLDVSHVPPIRKHKPDYTFNADADPAKAQTTCAWPALWGYPPTPVPTGAPSKPPPPTNAPSAPKPKASPPSSAPSQPPKPTDKPKSAAVSTASSTGAAKTSGAGASSASTSASSGTSSTTQAALESVVSSVQDTAQTLVSEILAEAVASFEQGEPMETSGKGESGGGSNSGSGGKTELTLGSHDAKESESKGGQGDDNKGDDGKGGSNNGGGGSNSGGGSGGSAEKGHESESAAKPHGDGDAEATTTTETAAAAAAEPAAEPVAAPEVSLAQLESMLSQAGVSDPSSVTADQLEDFQVSRVAPPASHCCVTACRTVVLQ